MFNTGICFRFPFNRSLSRHGHPRCFFLFFVAFSSSPSIHYSKGSSFSSHRSLTIIKNNEHCGCNIFGHKGNDCRNHYYCLSYNFHTTPRGNMRQFRTCFNGTWICYGALKMGKKTENCRLITLTCLCVYIECNFFQFKWLFHNKKKLHHFLYMYHVYLKYTTQRHTLAAGTGRESPRWIFIEDVFLRASRIGRSVLVEQIQLHLSDLLWRSKATLRGVYDAGSSFRRNRLNM